nr:fibronectin type III domain-containing protein [Bacteroidota bacterium]
MKKNLFFFMLLLAISTCIAQENYRFRQEFKSCKPVMNDMTEVEPVKKTPLKNRVLLPEKPPVPENADVVTIQDIGTSANAYSYGYEGGQRSIVCVNNALNMVTNFHRMGGALDPGGYSGDLGFDISTDGGMTWSNMNEVYVATNNAGGGYFTDAARYPNHGVYNPMGNTDPNEAYLHFWAPNLDGSNSPDSWGGYSFGRAKIGDISDTTKNLKSSHGDFYQYLPKGYTMTNLGEVWVTDLNQDWSSGSMIYQGNMIINHGTWNATTLRFDYEEFLIDCPTFGGMAGLPEHQAIEFAPDGVTGYIAVLADNGNVPISAGRSFYPILWKTNDGGETWSEPIELAIAGEGGVEAVQDFLSDSELAELFSPPVPARDEIEFTTAFDFDLSVDVWGNPHIAVVCGITGSTAYSIMTPQLNTTDYMPTAAFDISSSDGGDTWYGIECGRMKTFRGDFGDLFEDNRIQIARSPDGFRMFLTWLDTDLPGYNQNEQPDVWARGIDLLTMMKTANNEGADYPDNVTEFSEGMWQAYFQSTGNEVLMSGDSYTIPIVYEGMDLDPSQPVQYKYIVDFSYANADFSIPYIGGFSLLPPDNLQAVVEEDDVVLTWDAPENEGLIGYNVYRNGSIINFFTVLQTTYTDRNLPNGNYSYQVTSVYTEGESLPTPALMVEVLVLFPVFFEPVWSTPYNPMTIYVLDAFIDGVPLQIGDEIGLFDIDPNIGEEICVGAGVLTEVLGGGNYLEIIASMDDGSIPDQANGFTPGNQIIYRLWNDVVGEVEDVTATYPYPGYDQVFTPQGSAMVELIGSLSITQNIPLQSGWNLMSFRVEPENWNMLDIVEPLINEGVLYKVLDETGGSIFHLPFPPPNGQWSNTIGEMANTEGYYIKVTGNAQLPLEGLPVGTPLDIPLTEGWNIISYPCEQPQNALDAVQPLIVEGLLYKVIDETGGTIFHLPFPPPNGQWSNT